MKLNFNVNFMGSKELKLKDGSTRLLYSFLDLDSKRTFDLFTVESFVSPKSEPKQLELVNIHCDLVPKKDGSGFSVYLRDMK